MVSSWAFLCKPLIPNQRTGEACIPQCVVAVLEKPTLSRGPGQWSPQECKTGDAAQWGQSSPKAEELWPQTCQAGEKVHIISTVNSEFLCGPIVHLVSQA